MATNEVSCISHRCNHPVCQDGCTYAQMIDSDDEEGEKIKEEKLGSEERKVIKEDVAVEKAGEGEKKEIKEIKEEVIEKEVVVAEKEEIKEGDTKEAVAVGEGNMQDGEGVKEVIATGGEGEKEEKCDKGKDVEKLDNAPKIKGRGTKRNAKAKAAKTQQAKKRKAAAAVDKAD